MLAAAGRLELRQADATEVSGAYQTAGGATTELVSGALLDTGSFVQESGSTLSLAVGAADPVITTGSASLDGLLNLSGIEETTATDRVLIDSTAAITGDFAGITVGASDEGPDYLTLQTRFSDATRPRLQFLASYGLTWYANNARERRLHADDAEESFDVSAALTDVAPNPDVDPDWDGALLTKDGAGTLILSADNLIRAARSSMPERCRSATAATRATSRAQSRTTAYSRSIAPRMPQSSPSTTSSAAPAQSCKEARASSRSRQPTATRAARRSRRARSRWRPTATWAPLPEA